MHGSTKRNTPYCCAYTRQTTRFGVTRTCAGPWCKATRAVRVFIPASRIYLKICIVIPLSYLTARALHSNGIKPPPETLLVKALRAHGADAFEIRMLMTAPSRGAWGGGDSDVPGGYEVRLKDWRDALHRARNSAREEWESRMIYMVRPSRLPTRNLSLTTSDTF